MGFAGFLIRFLGYACVMAVAYEIGQFFWWQDGLDSISALTAFHAIGVAVVAISPLLLALIGTVARPVAVFVLFYLAGVIVTAPFAFARFFS